MPLATSAAVADRPTGVALPAATSVGSWAAVAIQPGSTAFAVTPFAAKSTATERVIPSIAALAVWYPTSPVEAGRTPAVEATLMIRPYPRWTIPGNAARVT